MRWATSRLTVSLVLGAVSGAVLLTLATVGCAPEDATDTSVVTTSEPATTTLPETSTTKLIPPVITLTDLYDNHALPSSSASGLKTGWGFACLIQGYESTILFDTGASGSLLLSNMSALDIDPQIIDLVVLSHQHSDHTGGLRQLLTLNPDLTVYCPFSFSKSFTDSVERAGATVVRVEAPVSPCHGVTLTEPLDGGSVYELGLKMNTVEGPVLLTGCAHPGVVTMAQAATDLAGEPLHAVLGGFHLYQRSSSQIADVIDQLLALGVTRCGPSHCTGDRAIDQFEEVLGQDFISLGVGAVVEF